MNTVNDMCLVCARRGRTEGHHAAGRGHVDALIIGVCLDCHRYLTRRQNEVGLLPYRVETTADDTERAAVVGVILVLERLSVVHAMTHNIADRLVGRAVSQTFDVLAPADRPGRWGPDPIGAALRPAPRTRRRNTTSHDDQTAIVVALVELVGELIHRFDPDPESARRVADLVTRTPQLVATWDAAMSDPDFAERATGLVARIVELINRLGRDLITTDNLAALAAEYGPVVEAAFAEWMATLDALFAFAEGSEP
jgi:hypothetical protein